MRTIIRHIGNSKGVIIPASFLAESDLQDEVEMSLVDRSIVISPAKRCCGKDGLRIIMKIKTKMVGRDLLHCRVRKTSGSGKGQPLGCRPVTQFNSKKARILLDQIRSIDKIRLGKRMGSISKSIWHPVLLDMLA